MTLKERYEEVKKTKQQSPAYAFVKELMQVTHKSEPAVRRWLCDGETNCEPDELTKHVLAEHFGCEPDELFPNEKLPVGK